jgi:hypothetical protein
MFFLGFSLVGGDVYKPFEIADLHLLFIFYIENNSIKLKDRKKAKKKSRQNSEFQISIGNLLTYLEFSLFSDDKDLNI